MAVPEQTPYIEHTGNGATTSFALEFQCESKDHLIVLVDDIEPPIATWSLTGGNVIFTTAPASGSKITLQRNTPFGRTADYHSFNNSFRPQSVNGDFDRLWLKLQELGVADWLMKLYVDRLHQQQEVKINDLKSYVDDRDDELRSYLVEEIRKQGVALDQLDEYYNYLMQRLAQIAVDKGWDASFVVDGDKNQHQINEEQKQINDDNIARAYANYTDLRYLNVSPSNNDQTQSVIDALNILSAQGFRDIVYIPKGVKFNAKTVFANLPIGIILKISDFTNWAAGNYKNKFDITFSSDLVNDDTQTIIGSGHHPAITLLNTGTSGSVSSNERLASILHSVGISQNGDPLPAQIMQFRKAGDTDDRWAWTLRALTSYQIAIKDPVLWVAGKSYAAGDMCLSDGGRVYVTATGGIAGSTAPTGTGTAINDGGVVWDYYAHRKSKDTTTFAHYEDGNTQIAGSGEEVSFTVLNGANRARLYVSSTGEVSLRDHTRSRNLISSSELRGVYSDGVGSIRLTNISGATPTLSASGARVINAAPVTMTALNLPAGQRDGMCYLHFVDGNTTLQHGGAFQLKGGVDVTPPANGFVTLLRNGAISGAWIEVSRSF